MNKKKLILIGNGMAGMNTVEKVIQADPEAYDITVFGRENHPNYNRIMLSSVLQGNTTVADIAIHSKEWYERSNITLHTGEEVTSINPENKTITTDQGTVASYDKLIIATGSNPFILPIPGADKKDVIPFRTLDDCEYIMKASSQMKKAVVIGGGLLGLEAARGLLNLGLEVDVVHLGPYLMERQLDEAAAKLLQKDLEKQGMNFLLEKLTAEITGEEKVEGVRFKDETTVAADMVVMSVGIAPNVKLAKENGIETNRGILVNDRLETMTPDIYAVGECAEHEGMVYGLVSPLYEQADVLAAELTNTCTSVYEGSLLYTQLKIAGLDVFSAGDLTESEETNTIQFYDDARHVYKKLIIREDMIQAAVLYGDVSQQSKLLSFISTGKIISEDDIDALMFSGAEQGDVVKALSLTANVCHCNNVSKGAIIQSVKGSGLTSVEEIKEQTKASSSCGGCKPMVADLLHYIQSPGFDEFPEVETICGCTDKTEEEVIEAIQAEELRTVEEVINHLHWKTNTGCRECVPAINYYLGMIFADAAGEENESMISTSLFKENDGTYTFSPQIYGGVIQPKELKRLAEIAEDFNIPSLQLTSNQRIQFSGVTEKQLQRLTKALNMDYLPVSFYNMEPIQTFPLYEGVNKAEIMQMAQSLEKKLMHLHTPFYVRMRMGTSAAEAAEVKQSDIAVINGAQGFEIYLAVGKERNQSDLLYVTASGEEAFEMICALFEYYREGARFEEAFGSWAERVNFIHLREVLFDPEMMATLLERLEQTNDSQQSTEVPFL